MSLIEELKKVGAIKTNGKATVHTAPVTSPPLATATTVEAAITSKAPVVTTETPLPGPTTQELKQTILDIVGPFLRASRKRLARISDLQQKTEQLQELLGSEIEKFTRELDEYEQVYKELEAVIGGAS